MSYAGNTVVCAAASWRNIFHEFTFNKYVRITVDWFFSMKSRNKGRMSKILFTSAVEKPETTVCPLTHLG